MPGLAVLFQGEFDDPEAWELRKQGTRQWGDVWRRAETLGALGLKRLPLRSRQVCCSRCCGGVRGSAANRCTVENESSGKPSTQEEPRARLDASTVKAILSLVKLAEVVGGVSGKVLQLTTEVSGAA